MVRRYLPTICLALALAAALLFPIGNAFAQAACSIQSEKPSIITGTTHTLAVADQCHPLIFTSGSAVAVTMPNAAVTLPAGFKVFIKAQGAGTVTLNTPTTSTIDGAAGPVSYTQGKGAWLWSDGTNYFTSGIGVIHP